VALAVWRCGAFNALLPRGKHAGHDHRQRRTDLDVK
jgi:hypothetical protein